VDFLRGESSAVSRVDELLAEGRATLTGPIAAEVLSGVRSSAEYERLKRLFRGLDCAPDPVSLWPRLAEYRFALARGGFRAGIVDLAIAITALDAGRAVLTRDRDFERIRTVIPIELEVF